MAIALRGTSISRTSSNGTLTLAASNPGAVEHDLMLAFVAVGETGATQPTFTPPAGWTLVDSEFDSASGPANYVKAAVYRKIAGASEPSTYTFTTDLATSSRFGVIIAAYSGVDTAAPIAQVNSSNGDTSNNTNRPTGSITTTGDRYMVLCVGDRNSSTYTAPSGYTQRAITNGQTPSAVVFDSGGTLPAGTYSYTITSSTSTSTTFGFVIALTPGVVADPPDVDVDQPAGNLVDLRGSTAGDSSTLTYSTPTRVSGPALAVSALATGIWLFEQDPSSESVYTVGVQQVDGQTASQNVTIPVLPTGASSNRIYRRRSGGVWR